MHADLLFKLCAQVLVVNKFDIVSDKAEAS